MLVARESGMGPLRIGTMLRVKEDMYSLLFCSFFNQQLIKKAEADAEQKEKAEV